jgi:hypothetical protein
MASLTDIQKTIFKSVFLVVKRATLPTMADFLKMKVADLKLSDSSPSDWSTFWAEILTSQIQSDCKTDLRIVIDDFSSHWFNDATQTMQNLIDLVNSNQLPAAAA